MLPRSNRPCNCDYENVKAGLIFLAGPFHSNYELQAVEKCDQLLFCCFSLSERFIWKRWL